MCVHNIMCKILYLFVHVYLCVGDAFQFKNNNNCRMKDKALVSQHVLSSIIFYYYLDNSVCLTGMYCGGQLTLSTDFDIRSIHNMYTNYIQSLPLNDSGGSVCFRI